MIDFNYVFDFGARFQHFSEFWIVRAFRTKHPIYYICLRRGSKPLVVLANALLYYASGFAR